MLVLISLPFWKHIRIYNNCYEPKGPWAEMYMYFVKAEMSQNRTEMSQGRNAHGKKSGPKCSAAEMHIITILQHLLPTWIGGEFEAVKYCLEFFQGKIPPRLTTEFITDSLENYNNE